MNTTNQRLVIYIASPYTKGDPAENTSVQMWAAHRILDLGHTPIAPLLTHFLHIMRQRSYEDWMQMDFDLVRRCDVLLRLPGESPGADREVECAKRYGIPVAMGWDELERVIGSIRPQPRVKFVPVCG